MPWVWCSCLLPDTWRFICPFARARGRGQDCAFYTLLATKEQKMSSLIVCWANLMGKVMQLMRFWREGGISWFCLEVHGLQWVICSATVPCQALVYCEMSRSKLNQVSIFTAKDTCKCPQLAENTTWVPLWSMSLWLPCLNIACLWGKQWVVSTTVWRCFKEQTKCFPSFLPKSPSKRKYYHWCRYLFHFHIGGSQTKWNS